NMSIKSSVHSSQRRPMAWEWACRFADRLLNHMAGVCGLHLIAPVEQSFSSRFQLAPPKVNRVERRRLRRSVAVHMSVSGTKRTCQSRSVMSAFGGKADIHSTDLDVRF